MPEAGHGVCNACFQLPQLPGGSELWRARKPGRCSTVSAWEMLAAGTQTPRRYLFVQGFTCVQSSLMYTPKGICGHQGGR